MSEPVAAAPAPKKKGKLPIILVGVLVLAGGGFFMKSQGAKKEPKKEPEIKLEPPQSLGPEFMARLSDGRTFLKFDMSVQKQKEEGAAAKKEEGASKTGDPILRDAVNMVLVDTSPKDIETIDGVRRLKERLAWAINRALAVEKAATGSEKDAAEPKKEKKESKSKKKKDEAPPADEATVFTHVPIEERDHPDWDSDTGPVHIVLFSNFITQVQ